MGAYALLGKSALIKIIIKLITRYVFSNLAVKF